MGKDIIFLELWSDMHAAPEDTLFDTFVKAYAKLVLCFSAYGLLLFRIKYRSRGSSYRWDSGVSWMSVSLTPSSPLGRASRIGRPAIPGIFVALNCGDG
ncbi:hypothetical protein PENSPDRAFT_163753 [Peniophora sp. CONT]|nr:hypothetical protein PENSPDRAFT_163753 [Peniophora sp. CONT]